MHVILNRSALVEILGVATGVVAVRTPKEVLRCVRLTVTDRGLVMSATDLEVALRAEVQQVEITKPGDVLVPADKLMSIARESVDETLTLEAEEQVCHIRGRDSHFEIYGQDPREFPPVPDLEGKPDMEVEAGVLRGLIGRTIFAVAKENTRYAINGVLWEKLGKRLVLVATDGRRLARATGALVAGAGGDSKMIVPAKTVHVLQRVVSHLDGAVGVRFSGSQVIVQAGVYTLSSALVDGQFPQYEDVIPKDSDKKVELGREELLSAVRRTALLSTEQSKGVRLAFSEGQLVLSSRVPEQGEATVSMAIEYQDEPLEVGFSPVFLIEALRVVEAPTVVFELKEANRPGVLKEGQEFTYVVMPVSLA
jgi:DNA polymerase-3 subunit beta